MCAQEKYDPACLGVFCSDTCRTAVTASVFLSHHTLNPRPQTELGCRSSGLLAREVQRAESLGNLRGAGRGQVARPLESRDAALAKTQCRSQMSPRESRLGVGCVKEDDQKEGSGWNDDLPPTETRIPREGPGWRKRRPMLGLGPAQFKVPIRLPRRHVDCESGVLGRGLG